MPPFRLLRCVPGPFPSNSRSRFPVRRHSLAMLSRSVTAHLSSSTAYRRRPSCAEHFRSQSQPFHTRLCHSVALSCCSSSCLSPPPRITACHLDAHPCHSLTEPCPASHLLRSTVHSSPCLTIAYLCGTFTLLSLPPRIGAIPFGSPPFRCGSDRIHSVLTMPSHRVSKVLFASLFHAFSDPCKSQLFHRRSMTLFAIPMLC